MGKICLILPARARQELRTPEAHTAISSESTIGLGWHEVRRLPCVPNPPKRFVYIIVSVNHPDRRYGGVTANVGRRLAAHNAGHNRSTIPWRPWRLEVCVEFRSEPTALRFEKYLKSGAGHAFASRHLVNDG